MNVKVYYRGLGWYSGRVKGNTLVYSAGKDEGDLKLWEDQL